MDNSNLPKLVKQIFRVIDTYYDKTKADKISMLITEYTELAAIQTIKDDIGIGRLI